MALIASTRERPLGSDQLFSFAVDADGRLRALDPVFAELSGAAIGDPVDGLRHPDVAYAVLRAPFAAEAGAAVLRLLGPDGAWFRAVLAVAPVASGGWVAAGFGPALPEPAVTGEVRAAERAGEDVAPLIPALTAATRGALVAEVTARDPRGGGTAAELLAALGRRLAGYGELADTLRRRSGFVEELAESIRLFALNAILAAHRLRDSAAIGAVAGLMKTRSDTAGPELRALGGDIEAAVAALEAASFQVAVGRAQAAVMASAPWVGEALAATLEAVAERTARLDAALTRLAARSAAVEEHLKTLRFLELQGRIEAARADDTQHVRMLFEEIGQQVRAASGELKAFSAARPGGDGAEWARRARAAAAELVT